jgi:hypothetical protein
MSHNKGLLKKSGVKDTILFQILEDTKYMLENDCPSVILNEPGKEAAIPTAIKKLKALFDIDENLNIYKEYELILAEKSNLPSAKRSVIKFLCIAEQNKYKPNPGSPEVVEGPVDEIEPLDNVEVIDAQVVPQN